MSRCRQFCFLSYFYTYSPNSDFWAAVLSISLPAILKAFTSAGTYYFYAGLNVVAFILIFLFLPETKQRTLEELDYVFGVPTRRHARFQVTEELPWWFRRWILFKKGEPEPVLYKLTGTAVGEKSRGKSVDGEKA